MKTVTVRKEQLYCGDLILVNAQYALREAAVPCLVPVDPFFPDVLLRRDAAFRLRSALGRLSAAGEIVPVSGYRSAGEQQEIYRTSLRENGRRFTRQYVAAVDHSEHQTGLAIDLGRNQKEIDFIRPDFPEEGICGAFRRAAPRFGFIERYAKGKEAVTGIAWEPWHFRYVGTPHAELIAANGFALEEYLVFLKDFRESSRYVYREEDGAAAEIYYVPAEEDETVLSVPDGARCSVSGNNADGYIVTVRRMQ